MGFAALTEKETNFPVHIVKHCQRTKKCHKDNFFDSKVLVTRLRADRFKSFKPNGLHLVQEFAIYNSL